MRFRASLGVRMALFIVVPVVIGLAVLAFFSLRTMNARLRGEAERQADNLVLAGSVLAAEQMTELQERARTSGAFVAEYIGQRGELRTDGIPVTVIATNQLTGERRDVTVAMWSVGGQRITGDVELVDAIQKKIGGVQSIFQKIDGGYLRIATNTLTADGNRRLHVPARR